FALFNGNLLPAHGFLLFWLVRVYRTGEAIGPYLSQLILESVSSEEFFPMLGNSHYEDLG
ncbi:MAG: hypothetical protein PHP93_03975, partial [Kiritimatiellales bacterium]|nr:hypothetical protein [Kiritimatiellales bacterium]